MKYVLLVLLSLGPLLVACGKQVDGQAPDVEPQAVESQSVEPPTASPEAANRESTNPAGIKPNMITWGTASEHDNFGYDVYRGLAEEGPFAAVNNEVIPGAGTTDLPQHYEFVDDSIEPDTTYWYYIESISLTGERKRITPVYPSKPKSAVAEESQ